MIAEARHIDASRIGRLDQHLTGFRGDLLTVNFYGYHLIVRHAGHTMHFLWSM